MNTSIFRHILAFAAAAALPGTAAAQSLTESVTVEGRYKPEVIQADRLALLPASMTLAAPESPMTYDRRGVTASFAPDALSMPATAWRAAKAYDTSKGYLDLRLGSWLNSSLSAGYAAIDSEDTRLNVWLQHNSTSLWQAWKEDEETLTPAADHRFRYDETIGAEIAHGIQRMGNLTAGLQYSLGYFNYYPTATRNLEDDHEKAPTQTINDVYVRAGWKGEHSRRLKYSIDADVRHFAYRAMYLPLLSGPYPGEYVRTKGERETAINAGGDVNYSLYDGSGNAITIAEEMSGMPGLAVKFKDGGIGFDYRMAMGIPDYWIKMIKEKKDEDWHPTSIFWELTNRRADEKTISYCESHDQALVGDKTIIFRLIDKEMYWHMMDGDNDFTVERGMALHKMIRLVTLASINGGYLNFMGNEFGHPEWIDFPREGNGWSYKYARRQWDLVDREDLKYKYLNRFDNAMIGIVDKQYNFQAKPVEKLWEKDDDQVLAFKRGDLIFVFNWSPTQSFPGYGFLAPAGEYEVILDSDSPEFGGHGLIDDSVHHFTTPDPLYSPAGKGWLKMYIPARTAQVLRMVKPRPGRRPAAGKTAEAVAEAPKAETKKTVAKKSSEKAEEKAPAKKATAKKTSEKAEEKAPAKKTAAKTAAKKTTTKK